MKKRLKTVVLGLMLAFLMAGCGQTNNTATNQGDGKVEEQETSKDSGQATASASEAVVLNIGFSSSDGTNDTGGILGLAMHQGFLDEELAAVNAVPEYYGLTGAGPAVNEALAAESLDIGLMGSTPAVTAKSQGIDTTVIAAKHDDQGGSIFVMGDSDIQSVEDLKGKSIGVTMGSEWQKSLDKTLELYGMTESDVEIVNLTLADLWEALTLKQVDAIENALPNLRDNIQSIIDGEVRIVADARNYDELESHGVFVVRTKFKEEHPEIVQAFVDAIYRAYLYADEHPDILRSEVTYSLDLYDYAYPNGPDNSLIADEAIVNYAQSTIDFMLEKDLILQGFDASAWIDNTFYEKAVETIGN